MVSATGNIGNEKARNLASFLRIKKGLKKKAFEFSTLVGVDTCMIILDPKQHGQGTDHHTIEPEMYPENLQEVHRIIQRYREYITTTTTTTTRDHECRGVSSTTTAGVVNGGKKKRNNRNLIQKSPAEIGVTSSSSSEQDDVWYMVQERALVQALRTLIPNQWCWEQVATAVPGRKTPNQCKMKFALLMKGGFSFNSEIEEEEELRNEFMGFDQQNVMINALQGITEEEDQLLVDSSCCTATTVTFAAAAAATAASSSEFSVEDDKYIWPNSDDFERDSCCTATTVTFDAAAATATAASSSEFLVEGDKYIWPNSDDLNEILNGFCDGDHHQHEENIFDLLRPLSPPLTTHEGVGVHHEDGSISTSDIWPTNQMVEWDQFFR